MKLLSFFQLATQILTFQPIKANFVYEVFILVAYRIVYEIIRR